MKKIVFWLALILGILALIGSCAKKEEEEKRKKCELYTQFMEANKLEYELEKELEQKNTEYEMYMKRLQSSERRPCDCSNYGDGYPGSNRDCPGCSDEAEELENRSAAYRIKLEINDLKENLAVRRNEAQVLHNTLMEKYSNIGQIEKECENPSAE